jgi:hypothetical protein
VWKPERERDRERERERKRDHWEDTGVDGRIKIRWIFKK